MDESTKGMCEAEEGRVLTDVGQCTAEWLTRVLRTRGCLREGRVLGVRAEVKGSTTASAARLSVSYSQDARGRLPRTLFLKVGDPAKLPALPRDFALGDARFYRRVASVADRLPIPACYDSAVDEERVRFHVLLEDLSATHATLSLGKDVDVGKCRLMMECLADFHAYWWAHVGLEGFGGVPSEDEPRRYARSVQETLPGFLDALGDDLSGPVRRFYERFSRDFDQVYPGAFRRDRLTVIHGDAHPMNNLLPRDGRGGGRIVDWQFHHVSVGTQDVRHTLGLDWPSERRRAMEMELLRHYHQHLVWRGVRHYPWDDCCHGYRVGMIDNLFMPMWQWTLKLPREYWFGSIERAVAAVRELECEELLGR